MKNFMLLCAFSLLLFGCDKKWPNRLTPKELEIDASEHNVEIYATRKIKMIHISSTELFPNTKRSGDVNPVNGVITYNESWFSMRVNTNDPDSCNVIKFHIKQNELGKKRRIVFTVMGDRNFQMPVGYIIQDIQH